MTDENKREEEQQQARFVEKRHEERFGVPDRCRQYMTLQIQAGKERFPAVLANFSRSGILFESAIPLVQGARAECIISISLLLSREMTFSVHVKYCYKNGDSYIVERRSTRSRTTPGSTFLRRSTILSC